MAGKPNPPKEYANQTGRPPKFNPERCASIIDAISRRVPYEMAAEANGITASTLYEWLKLGREHCEQEIDSPYSKFSEDIKKAEMQKVLEHTDAIASKPERWQADAWLLERRWYKHFGANAQLNELNEKLDRLLEAEKNEKRNNKEDSQEDD